MLHPQTELRFVDDAIGYGVFTTAAIPKGTITWAQDPLDQVLTSTRVAELGSEHLPWLERYSYVLGNGDRLLCWDFCRFMNHSCEANTLSPGLPIEVAVRDIAAGEELTSDYGALNVERPFACLCHSSQCRGTIHPDDFERQAVHWDATLAVAFTAVHEVEQPLAVWLERHPELRQVLTRLRPLPSILRHRYQPAPTSARRARRPRRAGRVL